MKVKVAFYKGKGNWKNKLICWWTGSPYSHVELIMADNFTWIGISPLLTSTVSARAKVDFDLENWDFVDLEVTQEQSNVILDFFKETEGCKYDWVGMFLSQFVPSPFGCTLDCIGSTCNTTNGRERKSDRITTCIKKYRGV